MKWWDCRSSDDDSKQGEIKRQLVELEREISLTTPLIAELDSRLTGQFTGADKPQSPTSPAAKTSSSAEPTIKTDEPTMKTVEVESSSAVPVEKMATTLDSGLQMDSSASSNRTQQVCWKLSLVLLKALHCLVWVTLSELVNPHSTYQCDRELLSMTLTFELDLDSINMSWHARYLDQKSYHPKLVVLTDTHIRPLKWSVNMSTDVFCCFIISTVHCMDRMYL